MIRREGFSRSRVRYEFVFFFPLASDFEWLILSNIKRETDSRFKHYFVQKISFVECVRTRRFYSVLFLKWIIWEMRIVAIIRHIFCPSCRVQECQRKRYNLNSPLFFFFCLGKHTRIVSTEAFARRSSRSRFYFRNVARFVEPEWIQKRT